MSRAPRGCKPGPGVPASAQARLSKAATRGFFCPECSAPGTAVIDSRPTSTRGGVRRRRICTCGHRFTTVEVLMVSEPSTVGRARHMRLIATRAAKLAELLDGEAAQAEAVSDIATDVVKWAG